MTAAIRFTPNSPPPDAKAHPFADLLRDRRIGALWGGLAFSAFGNELGRIAMVWLAIGLVGADAGFLPMAQNTVVLAVSLGAGLISHRLNPRLTMIGVDLASAVIAVTPVIHFMTVNSLSFLASDLAILGLGRSIDPPPQAPDSMTAGRKRGPC